MSAGEALPKRGLAWIQKEIEQAWKNICHAFQEQVLDNYELEQSNRKPHRGSGETLQWEMKRGGTQQADDNVGRRRDRIVGRIERKGKINPTENCTNPTLWRGGVQFLEEVHHNTVLVRPGKHHDVLLDPQERHQREAGCVVNSVVGVDESSFGARVDAQTENHVGRYREGLEGR